MTYAKAFMRALAEQDNRPAAEAREQGSGETAVSNRQDEAQGGRPGNHDEGG
ncbi:hypothetical protein FFM81_023090 (plasmid) [Rhizobium hidalgonense]|nr:hypothetical protein [Rhizobium hidalgonense]QKK25925.1 hypothetical protein FFM81_023090 [Rhizobium hidalgonense]